MDGLIRSQKARALCVLALFIAVALALSGCQALTGERQVGPTPQIAPAPDGEPVPNQGDSSGESLDGGTSGGSKSAQRAPGSESRSPSADVAARQAEQMIVRDKTLEMEVGSVRRTLTRVDKLAARYRASITNVDITSNGEPTPLTPEGEAPRPRQDTRSRTGPLTGTIVIRVPANKFEDFVRQARKLGTVQDESESAEDVTQQAIDMRARLKNLRAEEAAFLRFFRAAKTVRELIQVESELARVRGEIESLQAQLDFLERRVALATVTLKLAEPGGVVSPSGEDWGVVRALTQAIRNFVGVINLLIMLTGALLPFLIIAGVVLLGVRYVLKRRAARSGADREAPVE